MGNESISCLKLLLNNHMLCAQLRLILCNPMGRSPPGPSVHGILQAKILELAAMPSSRVPPPYSWLESESLVSPALAGRFFTTEPPGDLAQYP